MNIEKGKVSSKGLEEVVLISADRVMKEVVTFGSNEGRKIWETV